MWVYPKRDSVVWRPRLCQVNLAHGTIPGLRRSRYVRHRFQPEIISHAVWLYYRFTLSFREVEDQLADRGVTVSYETIRQWTIKFGTQYAPRLKRHQGRLGDTRYLDEVSSASTGSHGISGVRWIRMAT